MKELSVWHAALAWIMAPKIQVLTAIRTKWNHTGIMYWTGYSIICALYKIYHFSIKKNGKNKFGENWSCIIENHITWHLARKSSVASYLASIGIKHWSQ